VPAVNAGDEAAAKKGQPQRTAGRGHQCEVTAEAEGLSKGAVSLYVS
jgi:hypothetical protein